jgi:hypothetical protein
MQHAATDGVPRGGEACGLAPRLLLRILREGLPHQELLPHPQVQIPPPGEHPAIPMIHKLLSVKFPFCDGEYRLFTVHRISLFSKLGYGILSLCLPIFKKN